MCNSLLSMIRNKKQNYNENILNAGCFLDKTFASTQHSRTGLSSAIWRLLHSFFHGWFSACAWDVIPWSWSSEECFLWDSCQTHLQNMETGNGKTDKHPINLFLFTVNNGGLVTLVMRNTMKLENTYDVKSFTIFSRIPLHLEFLVAFGSTRTKYLRKVLVCVGGLFLNLQDFCFIFPYCLFDKDLSWNLWC